MRAFTRVQLRAQRNAVEKVFDRATEVVWGFEAGAGGLYAE